MSEAILRREKKKRTKSLCCLPLRFSLFSFKKNARQWDALSWLCGMFIVVDLQGDNHDEKNKSCALHFSNKHGKDMYNAITMFKRCRGDWLRNNRNT